MLKVINSLFVGFAIALLSVAYGQKGTQSPYSSLGLGELSRDGHAVFYGMGGIAMGNTDSLIVNTSNPASYVYLMRHKPVFQIGMGGRFSSFETESASSNQRHFGLNQFQLGIPIKKNWGAAIGIKPYSFTGYTITNYLVNEDEDTLRQGVAEGLGGIRIANLGLAFKPFETYKTVRDSITFKEDSAGVTIKVRKPVEGVRYQKMSIGVNGNFLFGTSNQVRSEEFLDVGFLNSRVEEGLRVSGLFTEVGLQYQFGFHSSKVSHGMSVGLTYSPETKVRAFEDIFSYSYVGSFYRGQQVLVLDTIEYVRDNQGTITKPETYGIGFEYRLGPAGTKSSQLRIGADLNIERWSSYTKNFSNTEISGGLKDRMNIGVGLEWVPYTTYSARNNLTPFFGKLRYRVGFNYTQTELLIKNNADNPTEIDNYGMSFGLGIPIAANNSGTNLNFGANFGNLGSTDNGLIQERYIGLSVGISITPGNGNYWFVKRKYD